MNKINIELGEFRNKEDEKNLTPDFIAENKRKADIENKKVDWDAAVKEGEKLLKEAKTKNDKWNANSYLKSALENQKIYSGK